MTLRSYSFSGWTWSAVIAGVVTSLIFQVLLLMAGYGVGLLTIDVPTGDAAPKAVTWAVFAWWAVSGVISAFVGGWVAGCFSDMFTPESRAAHALMSWAIATLIVIGSAAFATNTSIAHGLAGPTGTVLTQYGRLLDRGAQPAAQARATQAQIDQARRNLALAMLASFVALLVGAGAAVAGSQWLPEEATRVRMTPTSPLP
jgi:hypothetical protein